MRCSDSLTLEVPSHKETSQWTSSPPTPTPTAKNPSSKRPRHPPGRTAVGRSSAWLDSEQAPPWSLERRGSPERWTVAGAEETAAAAKEEGEAAIDVARETGKAGGHRTDRTQNDSCGPHLKPTGQIASVACSPATTSGDKKPERCAKP